MKLDYQNIISKVYTDIIAKENFGKVPSYIPELACIDDNKFGINFTDLKHNSFGIGDFEEKFSIQSISKVFALSFVYEKLDEKLWKRVDVEPSGSAFNSLVQLEADCGIPRNPFINAGALVICDILLEICNNPKQELIQFIRDLTGDQQIFFNEKVAASELENSFRNAAMCNFMKSFGNIKRELGNYKLSAITSFSLNQALLRLYQTSTTKEALRNYQKVIKSSLRDATYNF